MEAFKDLFGHFHQPGQVVQICIRPKRQEPVVFVDEVEAIQQVGLRGDRYRTKDGNRQVTLIQAEHLAAAASYLQQDRIPLDLVRRNILVRGINLLALKGKEFQVGEAVLAYSGECHPCSRMEENLGFGGHNAMRGHGGITAKIIRTGLIRMGDPIILL